MFCNICKYGVRSKHFSCIFVCYSQEARDSEQLGFLWIKSLLFILLKLKVKVFFSRCNKEVSMKRQEESRLMMLAWKARNFHVPWIHMHDLMARMTAFTQNSAFSSGLAKLKNQGSDHSLKSGYFIKEFLLSRTFPVLKSFLQKLKENSTSRSFNLGQGIRLVLAWNLPNAIKQSVHHCEPVFEDAKNFLGKKKILELLSASLFVWWTK